MIKDSSQQFRSRLQQHVLRNVTAAAIELQNQVKINISRPGRSGTAAGAKRLKARGGSITNRSAHFRYSAKGKLLGFTVHSRPGEYPRLQTGRTRGSVTREVAKVGDRVVGRVGTNVKWARRLEAIRPWLVRTLNEIRPKLTIILTKPMPL